MKYLFKILVVLAFAKALSSCNSESKIEKEISEIPINVELRTFHNEFKNTDTTDLSQLKAKYPYLFPSHLPDSIWYEKMQGRDTIYSILEEEVEKASFDYKELKDEVVDVMKHVKYYFPEYQATPITTIISEVDYRMQVVPFQEDLLISIDTYLGKDNKLYAGMNSYQSQHFNKENIKADVAHAIAKLFVEPGNDRRFLESIIYHGKLHYLQSLFAPDQPDHLILKYTKDEYEFTKENELEVWRYFIDQNLLYSTNPELQSRFIQPAPFSKFYLDIDSSTPGGIARYIGYKIVASYMENNEIDPSTLVSLPAETIFNNSQYKPVQQ